MPDAGPFAWEPDEELGAVVLASGAKLRTERIVGTNWTATALRFGLGGRRVVRLECLH